MKPYYTGESVLLYLGDCRTILPALDLSAALVLADPPYGETSLPWDRWPDGWLLAAAAISPSLWCFGSWRVFGPRWQEFTRAGWKFSQDIIWEKHNGSGFATDRFKRVHETATHWYQGRWRDIHHDVPHVAYTGPAVHAKAKDSRTPHTGTIGAHHYVDDGTRLMRSVIKAPSVRGGFHPTEKPIALLQHLIAYACPTDGLIIDPFAGSGATLDAARQTGRRAIGIEAHEPYAERAARRLEQLTLGA